MKRLTNNQKTNKQTNKKKDKEKHMVKQANSKMVKETVSATPVTATPAMVPQVETSEPVPATQEEVNLIEATIQRDSTGKIIGISSPEAPEKAAHVVKHRAVTPVLSEDQLKAVLSQIDELPEATGSGRARRQGVLEGFQPHIKALINKGYSVKMIQQFLTDKAKLTVNPVTINAFILKNGLRNKS